MQYKVGDRVRLIQDMCKQMNVRKLHGTVTEIVEDGIEVLWDGDSLQLMYESEIRRVK